MTIYKAVDLGFFIVASVMALIVLVFLLRDIYAEWKRRRRPRPEPLQWRPGDYPQFIGRLVRGEDAKPEDVKMFTDVLGGYLDFETHSTQPMTAAPGETVTQDLTMVFSMDGQLVSCAPRLPFSNPMLANMLDDMAKEEGQPITAPRAFILSEAAKALRK